MSECRVYDDPPWRVCVTHADEAPTHIEQITISCTMPNCGGIFRWLDGMWSTIILEKKSPPLLIMSFTVCACTRRYFQVWHGKCPPWLTREEEVAWRLS